MTTRGVSLASQPFAGRRACVRGLRAGTKRDGSASVSLTIAMRPLSPSAKRWTPHWLGLAGRAPLRAIYKHLDVEDDAL